jgi:tripartite-type tricarboxylate transporter receptor subunit TctC
MLGRSTVACFSMAVLLAQPAAAQTVEEFYKGKALTLVVGNGPGGGFDVFGRLLARYIGRYVPGNPSVVVQNMPGVWSRPIISTMSRPRMAPRSA